MPTLSQPKLQLGCGHIIKEGWLNHNLVVLPVIDVVHDLRTFPWPFEDGQFDEIYADNLPNIYRHDGRQ